MIAGDTHLPLASVRPAFLWVGLIGEQESCFTNFFRFDRLMVVQESPAFVGLSAHKMQGFCAKVPIRQLTTGGDFSSKIFGSPNKSSVPPGPKTETL
jgi:hypothetical protein